MIYIDDSEPEGDLEPAFPYRDVTIQRDVDANELYDILGEVGRGKFGTVYKCKEKKSGLRLAAKFVPIPKREDKRNVEREVEIMNLLQHQLVIQLYAAYEHQKKMCVILELVEGGELFDRVVDDEFVLTERVCVVFMRQVCEAMEFIHKKNILHLDLKPENILCLTQNGNRIKIIDFGLARIYDPDKRLQILFGTPEFVAPEVVNFDCISHATDMWSVGVICYVLISGLSPFMGETDIETMANVTIAKYDFEDESFSNISEDCMDFIRKLLVKDLSARMTATQCLQHPWLKRQCKEKMLNSTNSVCPKQFSEADELRTELKELDATKGNLKNFIERWEEHPNSPYVFDLDSNVISPLNETQNNVQGIDSMSSSRVCSPSPCESIDTLTDDDCTALHKENDSPSTMATPTNQSLEKLFPSTPNMQQMERVNRDLERDFNEQFAIDTRSSCSNHQGRSIRSYLHTFDRRNSDTNYLLGRRASGERINLAEEIRKLSDHLLLLAQINSKLDNENKTSSSTTSSKAINELSERTKPGSAAENKMQTKVCDSKQNRSTTKSSKMSNSTSSTMRTSAHQTAKSSTSSASASASASASTSTSASSTTTTSRSTRVKQSSLSVRLQRSIEETPKLKNVENSMRFTSVNQSSGERLSSTSSTEEESQTTRKTESASMRRAKFRVGAKSRDVPIGLPDTHQAINLEEAANTTKDCLLHLLEKYNETKTRTPVGRHQSISVDWNTRDNLEYRSMSSINAFFQRHNNTGDYVRNVQAQLEGNSVKKTK